MGLWPLPVSFFLCMSPLSFLVVIDTVPVHVLTHAHLPKLLQLAAGQEHGVLRK
jgi:hypothetical protein